jgi:hypothetical protein
MGGSPIGYRVVKRFDPASESWFWEFTGLRSVVEVVGLDCTYNPSVDMVLTDADWACLVYGWELGDTFSDWEHLRGRLPIGAGEQAVAAVRDPPSDDLAGPPDPAFAFMGFEVLDELYQISALTTGTFGRVVRPEDLSTCGLATELSRAREIRDEVRAAYPEDPHSDCTVWAVWRWEP